MNWINIPTNLDIELSEDNICDFCAADNLECGEYPECCYRYIIEKKTK